MREWSPAAYGDRFAPVYDDWYGTALPIETAVAMLAELAQGGRALELGVGTGRIALPLAARGVPIDGIDASEAMVERLRAKPGGPGLRIGLGDMAEVDRLAPAGKHGYTLVFVTFNTFFNLNSQRAQLDCLRGVARCLGPAGAFVVETVVPDLAALTQLGCGTSVSTRSVELGERAEVSLSIARADSVRQLLESAIIVASKRKVGVYPSRLRVVPPAELDLMAQVAGLSLAERWASWAKDPFTADSPVHVSVYRRERRFEFDSVEG